MLAYGVHTGLSMATDTSIPRVHVFEQAGLGPAPYRFLRMVKQSYQACHGAPVQPGGSCDYCGTGIHFQYWLRAADGREFKVGSDCIARAADKQLMGVVKEQKALQRAEKAEAKRQVARQVREQERASRAERAQDEFFAKYPEMRTALAVDHPIVRDIACKVWQWGSVSPGAVALVMKLVAESEKPAEVKIPAPTGKVVVRGTVVSVKNYDGAFGSVTKMVVKVTTASGVWLCFSSVPTWTAQPEELGCFGRGAEIEFTGTLSAGREPHFAIVKRPRKARVLKWMDGVPEERRAS